MTEFLQKDKVIKNNHDKHLLTVVIPTFNAGQDFPEFLDSLKKQTVKPSEIVIIDSGSKDNTVKFSKDQNCKVIEIQHAEFDHGTTRNLATADIKSEFVIFLSQDIIPADEYMIAELIKPMQADLNIAVCYGRQLPKHNATPLECFARKFNYPAESILKTRNDIKALGLKTFFCSNSCSAIRTSIFKELGGFKNNVIANEDMLFAAKAVLSGYSSCYSNTAMVYHSHSYSLCQKFKRYFDIGRFFADNIWILKNVRLKNYSNDMLKVGIKEFWKNRMPHYIVALLVEFTIKAIACKLGWYYQQLFHKRSVKK